MRHADRTHRADRRQAQLVQGPGGVDKELSESPRGISFCGHAILGKDIFEVTDALADDRFSDNPLVASQPLIRYYAGAPLITPDGYKLGTICAIDVRPRRLSEAQRDTLIALSRLVMRQLDRRRQADR